MVAVVTVAMPTHGYCRTIQPGNFVEDSPGPEKTSGPFPFATSAGQVPDSPWRRSLTFLRSRRCSWPCRGVIASSAFRLRAPSRGLGLPWYPRVHARLRGKKLIKSFPCTPRLWRPLSRQGAPGSTHELTALLGGAAMSCPRPSTGARHTTSV